MKNLLLIALLSFAAQGFSSEAGEGVNYKLAR